MTDPRSVIDEEWYAEPLSYDGWHIISERANRLPPDFDGEVAVVSGGFVGETNAASARLMAAAPDMARLLLKLGENDVPCACNDGAPCAWCGRRYDESHVDRCEFERVMLKAGLR